MITDKLGHKCFNQDEVINLINILYTDKAQINQNHFNQFDFDILQNLVNQNASIIINQLNSIITKQLKEKKINVSLFKIYFDELFYSSFNIIKYPIRKYFFPAKHRKYLADKKSFGGFNKETILTKVKKIEKITNTKIKLKFIGSRFFLFKLKT